MKQPRRQRQSHRRESRAAVHEVCGIVELPPADAMDPVIETFKKDVDRTLLRENLRLTPAQRARKFLDFARFAAEIREAGHRAREKDPSWGLK